MNGVWDEGGEFIVDLAECGYVFQTALRLRRYNTINRMRFRWEPTNVRGIGDERSAFDEENQPSEEETQWFESEEAARDAAVVWLVKATITELLVPIPAHLKRLV